MTPTAELRTCEPTSIEPFSDFDANAAWTQAVVTPIRGPRR